jgi:Protein of unknown function (DUF1236)
MTSRFMISVAALALIAGTGFANAQGTGTSREGASSGSSVQQSAPSSPSSAPSSATPSNRNEMNRSDAPDNGAAKTTQSEEKMQPGGAKNQRAQDEMKAGQKGAQDKSAQEKSPQDNMKGEKSKSMSSENDNAKGAKDMKSEGRDSKMNAQGQGREDRNTAQGREGRDTNMNAETKSGASTTTTGQVGASAKLPPEQRTKITTVIKEQHVQPVTNVTFDIRPGVRIPREHNVKFYPLPREVVTIYPQWRGYEYILVKDKIVVVDPRTYEIVDVLDV